MICKKTLKLKSIFCVRDSSDIPFFQKKYLTNSLTQMQCSVTPKTILLVFLQYE